MSEIRISGGKGEVREILSRSAKDAIGSAAVNSARSS